MQTGKTTAEFPKALQKGQFPVPTFDLTIRGERYHVEIPDPAASPLTVIVDGESFVVELAGMQSAGGAQHEHTASPPIVLPDPPSVAVALPVRPVGSNTGSEITAPMPGTILSIAVGVGDSVKPGQLLCVLEAMKMKNPIRTSQGGQVTLVNIAAGQNVAFGDLLVSLA